MKTSRLRPDVAPYALAVIALALIDGFEQSALHRSGQGHSSCGAGAIRLLHDLLPAPVPGMLRDALRTRC